MLFNNMQDKVQPCCALCFRWSEVKCVNFDLLREKCVTLVGVAVRLELCADNWVAVSAQVYDRVELGTTLVI